MQRTVSILEFAKRLYLRFSTIWPEKFVKPYHTEEFISVWYQEWAEGLEGIKAEHIKKALDYCKMNLDWPPSIAEFRRYCEKVMGLPTLEEALQKAIRRDFSHPVIAITYEKIGSWNMTHAKEEVLIAKFKTAFHEALDEFRQDSDHSWKKLEDLNAKQKVLSIPDKIPTANEIKHFKERYAEWQQKAEEVKKNFQATG